MDLNVHVHSAGRYHPIILTNAKVSGYIYKLYDLILQMCLQYRQTSL